jgi:two-component system, NarL family, nitrate/nitrite response regulator NarL
MSGPPIRVTVVDDHSLLAESLVIALRMEHVDARCVTPTVRYSREDLERIIVESQPSLVVLDLDLGPVCSGMSLISALRSQGIAVVVLTGSADRLSRGEALSLGASTVLSKSAPFREILRTVQRVREGLSVISSEERTALIVGWREARAAERDVRRRFEQLTRREAEVLGQLMEGHQVSEIAKIRFVSESTVRTQVKSVLAKLQVSSQLTAVGLAHQLGWAPPVSADGRRGKPVQRQGPGEPVRRQAQWADAG